ARTGGVEKAVGPAHDLLERGIVRQTGEDDVGMPADVGRRARRHAANLLELCERAATIADHRVAALDQVLADRQADLADADEADFLHALVPPSVLAHESFDSRSPPPVRRAL